MFQLIFVSLVLAGCAAVGNNMSQSPAPLLATHVAGFCAKHEQSGCLELQIENFQFNPKNQLMQELLQSQRLAPEVRAERIKTLPPELFKAYKRGEVDAAAPGRYIFFFWKINKTTPMSDLNSWNLNGTKVRAGHVEDVTESFASLKFGPLVGKPKPDGIYRVTANGDNPAGVSFQAPVSFYTKDTVVMIYSERPTVYPGSQNGLWVSSKQLEMIRTQGWRWVLFPFLLHK